MAKIILPVADLAFGLLKTGAGGRKLAAAIQPDAVVIFYQPRGRGLRRIAQEREDLDGLGLALERNRPDVPVNELFARQLLDAFADQNVRVKLFRRALETRREVHAIAEHGELHALRVADIADDDSPWFTPMPIFNFSRSGCVAHRPFNFSSAARICSAALTARFASSASPSLCVSPHAAMMASPMNFCSVPDFFLQNHADHLQKIFVELRDQFSRVEFSVMLVNPRMSLNKTVTDCLRPLNDSMNERWSSRIAFATFFET
jgi:hypothetical protein